MGSRSETLEQRLFLVLWQQTQDSVVHKTVKIDFDYYTEFIILGLIGINMG